MSLVASAIVCARNRSFNHYFPLFQPSNNAVVNLTSSAARWSTNGDTNIIIIIGHNDELQSNCVGNDADIFIARHSKATAAIRRCDLLDGRGKHPIWPSVAWMKVQRLFCSIAAQPNSCQPGKAENYLQLSILFHVFDRAQLN